MITRQINIRGGGIPRGQTCTVDHVEQTVTIKLSSLQGIPLETLKNHLQKKWKVLEMVHEGCDTYLDPGTSDF